MKRIICMVLLAGMLAGILLGCAEDTPANQDRAETPGGGLADEAAPGDDGPPPRLTPNLPEDAHFDGHIFTVLSHLETSGYNWYSEEPREVISEELTGEPINDAVFRRNATLAERHGFEFALVAINDEVGMLRRVVNAGDDVYDAVIIYNRNVPSAVQSGLLVDVAELGYIDWDKPWWDDAVADMTVLNRKFLLAGDLLILDNEATNALVFNKDMMRDLGHALPYDLVEEGRWTLDAFEQLVRGASADLTGDGTMGPFDQYGLVTFNDALHAFFVGAGGILAVKDDEDIPVINFASERHIRIAERVMDFLYDDELNYNVQRLGWDWADNPYQIFQEGRALFMWVRMRVIETLRGMDADFGILPMPKFDENQTEYRSVVNAYTGVLLGVPLTAPDLARTSIILEATSAESRYTLQPAYYDIVLQRQFARDEESEGMLDIIFSTRIYDVAAVYGFGGNVWLDFIGLASSQDRGIATMYERRSPAFQRDIDRLVERIRDMY